MLSTTAGSEVCDINRPVLSHIPAVLDSSSKQASSTLSFAFRLYEFALSFIVKFAFFYVFLLRFSVCYFFAFCASVNRPV